METNKPKLLMRFHGQRHAYLKKGRAWNLTFEQWCELWEYSGKWDQRGKFKHQYCLWVLDKDQPFELGNVAVMTCSERGFAPIRIGCQSEWRAAISKAHKGKKHSEATKAKMRKRTSIGGRPVRLEIEGVVYESLTAAAKALGISQPAMTARLKTGKWPYKVL
ncbi:hypothetical protein WG922_13535 [Ramlibacter sp. AN1015]|uniref:hypothetical protein n=1 Tax=Ramlibacter sp. AN1015 TaxID=3133428 RepID=UPI0030C24084